MEGVIRAARPRREPGHRSAQAVPRPPDERSDGHATVRLMCVVRRMFGAQVCSVVRLLFGCGLVGLLVVFIVPLFLSFLAMPGLCCFLHVTPPTTGTD